MLSEVTIAVYFVGAVFALAALYLSIGTVKILWLHRKRLLFGWIIFYGALGILKILTTK